MRIIKDAAKITHYKIEIESSIVVLSVVCAQNKSIKLKQGAENGVF